MVALEGLEVVHKVFGNGIVEKVSDKYVTVRFANLQKVFVYPDAFEVFLSAVDEVVSREIAADLAKAKEKRKAHDEELEKEREVQMRAGVVSPGDPGSYSQKLYGDSGLNDLYSTLPEDPNDEA